MRAQVKKKAPVLPDPGPVNQATRSETDESLRVERDKTDAAIVDKRAAIEEKTDVVVQVARDRADEVVQNARDDADRQAGGGPTPDAAASDAKRTREDSALERERVRADAVLEREREERRHYLSEFLAVEREATNQKLTEERVQVDEALSARDEFLATVSHDLRALLASLVFNADQLGTMAPEGDAGDRIRVHTGLGRRLAARMSRMVNDLLDVASIDAGKLAIVPGRVAVAKLLEEAVDAFGPIAAAAHVVLKVNPPDVPLYAKVDDGRIAQVLANLISNAVKFTPAQGTVSVHVRREGNEIVFRVTDTGIGIPPADLESVFGRLRQVSPDRRGLGLGLYISKSLVEAHGGRIWAENNGTGGSSFQFTVPAEPQP